MGFGNIATEESGTFPGHFENTHHHLAEAESRVCPFLLLVTKSLPRKHKAIAATLLSASHLSRFDKGLTRGLLREKTPRPVLCAVGRDRTDILTSQRQLNVLEGISEG